MLRVGAFCLALTACLALALPLAPTAYAATFTVSTGADDIDILLGDGVCATRSGTCSLRAAIMEANRRRGLDTIVLPAGVFRIVGRSDDLGRMEDYTGDLDIAEDLVLVGAGVGRTVIEGRRGLRVFEVNFGAHVTMRDLTIRRSASDFVGGGIYNAGDLTLERVALRDNRASDGGAIYSEGTLSLRQVSLSGNTATSPPEYGSGGALYLRQHTTAILVDVWVARNHARAEGGGIFAESYARVSLTNVTLSGNRADRGGAIYDESLELTLTNATISGNRARFGGGIRTYGALLLTNVTIADNSAEGGGGIRSDGAAVPPKLWNTLLARNGQNCDVPVMSFGNNLEDQDACGFGATDLRQMTPRLAGLASNGGFAPTHALRSGSPAVDAGDDRACPPTDQRGRGRKDVPGVGSSTCDIGAFEAQ